MGYFVFDKTGSVFDDRKPTLPGVYKTKHDFKYARFYYSASALPFELPSPYVGSRSVLLISLFRVLFEAIPIVTIIHVESCTPKQHGKQQQRDHLKEMQLLFQLSSIQFNSIQFNSRVHLFPYSNTRITKATCITE